MAKQSLVTLHSPRGETCLLGERKVANVWSAIAQRPDLPLINTLVLITNDDVCDSSPTRVMEATNV